MKTIYHESIPSAIRPLIQERFDPFLHLLPGWCSSFIVAYSFENPHGSILSCTSEYHYRFVQIVIYDQFLNDPDWENSICHEISHALIAPFSSQVSKLMGLLNSEDPTTALIKSNLTDAEEAFAQDLSEYVIKLLDKSDK